MHIGMDVGEKTLADAVQQDEKAKDSYPFRSDGREIKLTREIPRVQLRKMLQARRELHQQEIIRLQQEIRELDQFEKTISSLSESIQDGLAPGFVKAIW